MKIVSDAAHHTQPFLVRRRLPHRAPVTVHSHAVVEIRAGSHRVRFWPVQVDKSRAVFVRVHLLSQGRGGGGVRRLLGRRRRVRLWVEQSMIQRVLLTVFSFGPKTKQVDRGLFLVSQFKHITQRIRIIPYIKPCRVCVAGGQGPGSCHVMSMLMRYY